MAVEHNNFAQKHITISRNKSEWKKNHYSKQKELKSKFATISDVEVPELCTQEDLAEWSASDKLGFPGEYPYTRGVQPSMYRGRIWTMRQFAGFGSPEDTNERFHYLLQHGITGLSTAFDMPTLMGYDPDHPRSIGEVGREGVNVATIEDMEILFKGIDLGKVTTSMTINCSASPILAMYFALGKRQGVSWNDMGGTIQNDILKEYIAQKEWICPPKPGVRIVCDMIEFCSSNAPRFHAVSISGYHIREAGSTAAQELAFTLYDGITYVEECVSRGLDVDSFAGRLSFFFDVHNDFFEEIAKFRAARRMWANIMKKRFNAKNQRSLQLRTHAQTAGVSLTAQQPLNNIARVSLQALAAVLGGTQSLHTNSMDETYALPTAEAVKVALRTQQIIAEETGVANTIDPLAGSYFVETMTDEIEAQAYDYINKLDNLGGMYKAIELGFPQKEIAEASYNYQKQVEQEEQTIVGVNKYIDDEEQTSIPLLKIDSNIESSQVERIKYFKKNRDANKIVLELDRIKNACESGENLMPILIDAVDIGVTLGEVCDVYREVFGVYTDPGLI
jgi:methylmalonyl-CoA mutase, N-terminal domain